MWNQIYNPLGNAALSTIAAALPVVTLLVLIASGKVKAHLAAIIALIVANIITIFVFTMPADMSIRCARSLQLGDHVHHPREIRVARVGRRRVNRDEADLRCGQHLLEAEGEGDPLAVFGDQLSQARLEDRNTPGVQRLDLRGVDVAQGHLVPE